MEASYYAEQYGNYLSGFHDVYNHENACQTITGLLKILSYCTVVPLVVVGILYWKYKNIAIIDTEVDKKRTEKINGELDKPSEPSKAQSEARKVEFVSLKTLIKGETYKDQDAMVAYLVGKLDFIKPESQEEQETQKEMERFQKGFRLLDFEHQKLFFEKVISKSKLEIALQYIPRDVKILNFYCGSDNPLNSSNAQACIENTRLFLKVLPEFAQLRELGLDLKGTGFFCPSANESIKKTIHGTGIIVHGPTSGDLSWGGATYSHYNDPDAIVRAMHALRKIIRQKKENRELFEYRISCGNLSITEKLDGGEISLSRGVSGKDGVYPNDTSFAGTAVEFLMS